MRAADWLEKNGYIPEAIQHLFSANEMGLAAGLIERHGPARWTESDPSVLQMADSLSEEVLLARPKLGLYQAWTISRPSRRSRYGPIRHGVREGSRKPRPR